MELLFIPPRPELSPYVEKMWLFRNDGILPPEISLIAPNAKPKIIISYRNALVTSDESKTAVCQEHEISFIGIRDMPVTLTSLPGASESIGIELSTAGAYKFLDMPLCEITNQLFSFTDLYHKQGRELKELMMDKEKAEDKIAAIQDFLCKRLTENSRNNPIVDYSVSLISSTRGMVDMKTLEKKTGYSRRYLNMLFQEHLGISPKTYATILRFQQFYRLWSKTDSSHLARESIYELYYDQAHFIKEFKRYTGHSPMQFAKRRNDFGMHF